MRFGAHIYILVGKKIRYALLSRGPAINPYHETVVLYINMRLEKAQT